jgi:hypothetical protein
MHTAEVDVGIYCMSTIQIILILIFRMRSRMHTAEVDVGCYRTCTILTGFSLRAGVVGGGGRGERTGGNLGELDGGVFGGVFVSVCLSVCARACRRVKGMCMLGLFRV